MLVVQGARGPRIDSVNVGYLTTCSWHHPLVLVETDLVDAHLVGALAISTRRPPEGGLLEQPRPSKALSPRTPKGAQRFGDFLAVPRP